jgi:hypothetical protein
VPRQITGDVVDVFLRRGFLAFDGRDAGRLLKEWNRVLHRAARLARILPADYDMLRPQCADPVGHDQR